MSHMVRVASQFKSLMALRKTCHAFNLILEGEGEVRLFGKNKVISDYVLRLNGQFDLGFIKDKDGLKIVGDDMLITGAYGYVDAQLGKSLNKLKQRYALEVLKIEARKKNMTLVEQKMENGQIKVQMTRR